MKFHELLNISERNVTFSTPLNREKVLMLGEILRLNEDTRVIDFGCGYGELLALWGVNFGISGAGIDIREFACERAENRMADHGLDGRIEIIHQDIRKLNLDEMDFDIAVGMGISFIRGSFRDTLKMLQDAVHDEGKILIGEPCWLEEKIPAEYSRKEPFHTPYELLQIARNEGYDFQYLSQANRDELDHYESEYWRSLIEWIEANPDHPGLKDVIKHLHSIQDEYLKYGRKYLGWVMLILNPIKYKKPKKAAGKKLKLMAVEK